MCGRYYLDEQLKYDLTRWVIIPDGHIFPYGDIHPGEEGFIILKGHYGDYKTWGYPLNQKRVFNARIETVLEKKMFKEDAVKRRCIIPISGFYEWDRAHAQYRFTNNHILYLAGIYHDDYFTILTDYSLVIAPVVADLCTTPVALSAPPNSYQNNSQS